jgi:hypothetical protein
MSYREMEKNIMKTNTINTNHSMFSSANIFEMSKNRVSSETNGATVFIPHVCNNIDLFGAGFAADIADKFPSVKADYHMLGKNFLKNNFGYAQIIKVMEETRHKQKLYIVNMIAQNGVQSNNNPRPLNYFALAKSMGLLSSFILSNTGYLNKSENIEIHCPKFGSGLAGGNWNFISELIEDVWGRYNVTVHVLGRSGNKYEKERR